MTTLPPPFTRDPRPSRATAQIRVYIGFPSACLDELVADFDRVVALYPGANRAEVARRIWSAGVESILRSRKENDR